MRSVVGIQIAVLLIGCNSGPDRVLQPGIDPASAGAEAIKQYDVDGDGILSNVELKNSPALLSALERLDLNGDKAVTSDEIGTRISAWKEMKTGMASVRCHVTLDGRPLEGAEVVFEPEPFLGNEIKAAKGISNQFGDVGPTIAVEDRPDPKLPGGVHFGFYKVRISKQTNGRELIPARYNVETTLGQEISYDNPAMIDNNMAFNLTSGS